MNSKTLTHLIRQYDAHQTLDSVRFLADQCRQAWDEVKDIDFPADFKNARTILFCGMGGSAYGGRIIKSLFGRKIKIPVDLVSDYQLPGYVNSDTLVIAASYSGNTEETVAGLKEAIQRKAKIITVSSGGILAEAALSEKIPHYSFNPQFNPSGQPRLGQGYMQMGQLAILSKLEYINVGENEVFSIIDKLNGFSSVLSPENNTGTNKALTLAGQFEKRIIILFGSGFLEGAIHAFRNPLHETAKQYAEYHTVPELNHHLMEGLAYPVGNRKLLLFVPVRSAFYPERIKLRMRLTEEVIKKNKIGMSGIQLEFPTETGQVFELIQLGGYISFYLAMLHRLDPALIPWVDYFKNKLKKELPA